VIRSADVSEGIAAQKLANTALVVVLLLLLLESLFHLRPLTLPLPLCWCRRRGHKKAVQYGDPTLKLFFVPLQSEGREFRRQLVKRRGCVATSSSSSTTSTISTISSEKRTATPADHSRASDTTTAFAG
jgi:hypothetical protein